MDITNLLFTYQGRINRGKYWLAVLFYVIGMVIAVALGFLIPVVGLILAIILYIVIFVSGIFVGIKRLHDRDKTGWWLLFFYLVPGVLSGLGQASNSQPVLMVTGLISLAISIWMIVELGCLRGTVGTNQYGPDPLAGQA
jgi:uncharacterized membrane protein YhaH (DUF805 family)